MNWKFSANAGFFSLRRDRFTEYQPYRSLEERFELVARVGGTEGIELKYPKDFEDVGLVRRLMRKYNFQPAAVNVDIKDAAYFRYGALSANSAETRQRAVSLLQDRNNSVNPLF